MPRVAGSNPGWFNFNRASGTGLDLPALPLPLLLPAAIQVPVNLRAKDLHDTPWRAQAHGAAPVTQSNLMEDPGAGSWKLSPACKP